MDIMSGKKTASVATVTGPKLLTTCDGFRALFFPSLLVKNDMASVHELISDRIEYCYMFVE